MSCQKVWEPLSVMSEDIGHGWTLEEWLRGDFPFPLYLPLSSDEINSSHLGSRPTLPTVSGELKCEDVCGKCAHKHMPRKRDREGGSWTGQAGFHYSYIS